MLNTDECVGTHELQGQIHTKSTFLMLPTPLSTCILTSSQNCTNEWPQVFNAYPNIEHFVGSPEIGRVIIW